MTSKRLTMLIIAAMLLAGGFGLGLWLRGEPSLAAQRSCPYSGGGPPFAMQSFEADRARSLYLDAQRLAATNALFPEDKDFHLFPLTVGAERFEDPEATIPAEILYAIGWIESATNQTAIEVPYGQLGPSLVSFDCGYGIMQVTSSIVNDGGLPSRYEALVGTHFAYNIAAGARILSEKWNEAIYPSVGARDPRFIESWYYALWAYNGWAGVNHPLNPIYDPFRSVYDCRGRANAYPYQERVLGCVISPPEVDGQRLWEPLAISMPDRGTLATVGGPLDLDTFYAGLDTISIHIDGAVESPFSEMDLPLPDGAVARPSTHPAPGESTRARILGRPALRLETAAIELTSAQLETSEVSLVIHNDGTGLLAWRVVDAPSWLKLDVSAGVALGGSYAVVNGPQASRLTLSSAAGGVPEGSHQGAIRLAFHDSDGGSQTETIAISLDKRGAAAYEAGRPQS